MTFTLLSLYWEEGSRPGMLKCNLTQNYYVFDAATLEDANRVMEKAFLHKCNVSRGSTLFHSILLFDEDVSDMDNPMGNRKYWKMENDSVVTDFDSWSRKSERPGSWAKLSSNQQQLVAQLDRHNPELANKIAIEYQHLNRQG